VIWKNLKGIYQALIYSNITAVSKMYCKGKFDLVRTMKAYLKVEIQMNSFLIVALDKGE
jgi:hypothetical protein